jgi:hypothetical protein
MFSDDVQQGRARTFSIVKICDAVRKTRAQMKQGHCRLPGHPAVTVSSARADTFKDTEDRPDAGYSIKGNDDGQLGGPCIGKTDLDTGPHSCSQEYLCAIHTVFSFQWHTVTAAG